MYQQVDNYLLHGRYQPHSPAVLQAALSNTNACQRCNQRVFINQNKITCETVLNKAFNRVLKAKISKTNTVHFSRPESDQTSFYT